MIVLAMAPETYALGDLARAAQFRENRMAIIETLEEGIASVDTAAAADLVDNVLVELVSFTPLAESQPDQHLIVRYDVAGAHDDPGMAWEPIVHDDRDGQDYGGIDLLSYPALLGMDVKIEGDHFFEGFAWLLWELTFEGAEAVERAKNIQDFRGSLVKSDAEFKAFDNATAKMRRFLDDYAKRHIADPDLPSVMETYWPLTEGIKAPLDEGADLDITIAEQDPKLLARFMKRFGKEFRQFE